MIEGDAKSTNQADWLYRSWLEERFQGALNLLPVQFEPAKGTLLVKMVPPASVTKSGLIIPDSAQRQESVAIVVKVPADEKRYKPNDYVYLRATGSKITFASEWGGEHRLVQVFEDGGLDGDVLGKFDMGDDPGNPFPLPVLDRFDNPPSVG